MQEWILGSGWWLKQTHPDFWDLEVKPESFERIKRFMTNQKSSINKDKSLPFEFNRLVKVFHHESWLMQELKTLSKFHDLSLNHPHNQSEMAYCLEIVNHKKCTINGHSKLFHALQSYVHMCPISKMRFLSDTLIDLLIHEPYPKTITKIISQNALILCQTQKSYKPLIKLIELHLENDHQNLALTSLFHHYVKEIKMAEY
jgi:hypothetical protein